MFLISLKKKKATSITSTIRYKDPILKQARTTQIMTRNRKEN
jgi:hypothetical protein